MQVIKSILFKSAGRIVFGLLFFLFLPQFALAQTDPAQTLQKLLSIEGIEIKSSQILKFAEEYAREKLNLPNSYCAFPARAFLVSALLRRAEPDFSECTEFKEFELKAPSDEIAVLFAAESLSKPASMLGHIALVLSGDSPKLQRVEHAVSFFTRIDDVSFPVLVFQSLISGKRGYYSLTPFAETLRYYNETEQRNVWVYPIKLNAYELLLLRKVLFELKGVEFRYFFHFKNCATLIRDILGIVDPVVSKTPGPWVTPQDVVARLGDLQKLNRPRFYPATAWKVRAIAERYEFKASDRSSAFANDNSERTLAQIELQLAQNRYDYEQGTLNTAEWETRYQNLVRAREVQFGEIRIFFEPRQEPKDSKGDSQVSFGFRSNDNSGVLNINLAGHSLYQDHRSEGFESELQLLSIQLGLKSQLEFEKLLLFHSMFLQPSDSLMGGWSWLAHLAIEKFPDEKFLNAAAGIGKTYRLLRDIDGYGLLELGLGSDFKSQTQKKMAAHLGVIIREVFNLKTIAELRFENWPGLERPDRTLIEIQQALQFQNWIVSLSVNGDLRTQVVSNQLLLQFGF